MSRESTTYADFEEYGKPTGVDELMDAVSELRGFWRLKLFAFQAYNIGVVAG